MRGNHDTSDTYPFKVVEIANNPPLNSGGFRVQHVAKQEYVDEVVHTTYAEALGSASDYKQGANRG